MENISNNFYEIDENIKEMITQIYCEVNDIDILTPEVEDAVEYLFDEIKELIFKENNKIKEM